MPFFKCRDPAILDPAFAFSLAVLVAVNAFPQR